MVQLEGQWRGDEGKSGLVGSTLVPYADAFGLQRFRENELIHGRWAMLACLGVCSSPVAQPSDHQQSSIGMRGSYHPSCAVIHPAKQLPSIGIEPFNKQSTESMVLLSDIPIALTLHEVILHEV